MILDETFFNSLNKYAALHDLVNVLKFCLRSSTQSEVYSEHCQTSKMKRFAKIVNDFKEDAPS